MGTLSLILLGPPGAGKGTQAKMIVDRHGIPQISTGDLLRAAIASGSEMGEKVKSFVSSGGLVPDELVLEVLTARLGEGDCQKGFILDGYPRNVSQAQTLSKALVARKSPLSGVIAIEVPDEELVARLTGRRMCRQCGASYHVRFSPPKVETACDRCQGELYQRKDDSAEVISNRLQVYHDQTLPLIDFYRGKGTLHLVDGTGDIGVIFSQICGIIDSLKS